MVHRERVVKFVGREDELGQILACFSARSDRSPRVMILHALGGQGKSQIALEYCRRSRQTYRGIFWINANSEALVLQSFQRMLMKLTSSPSSPLPQDAEERVEMVKHVLEYWQERWLIVFDNYDDPIAFPRIRRFIPSGKWLHYQIFLVDRSIQLVMVMS
jgi:AAA ATPase domain